MEKGFEVTMLKSYKDRIILCCSLFIIIFGLFLHFYWLINHSPLKYPFPVGWDTAGYTARAMAVLEFGYSELVKNWGYVDGYSLLLAVLGYVGIDPISSEYLVPLILGYVLSVIYFLIIYQLTKNRIIAFLAFVFSILSPAFIRLVANQHRQLLALILFYLSLISFCKACEARKTLQRYAFIFLLYMSSYLMLLSHQYSYVLFGILLISVIIYLRLTSNISVFVGLLMFASYIASGLTFYIHHVLISPNSILLLTRTMSGSINFSLSRGIPDFEILQLAGGSVVGILSTIIGSIYLFCLREYCDRPNVKLISIRIMTILIFVLSFVCQVFQWKYLTYRVLLISPIPIFQTLSIYLVFQAIKEHKRQIRFRIKMMQSIYDIKWSLSIFIKSLVTLGLSLLFIFASYNAMVSFSNLYWKNYLPATVFQELSSLKNTNPKLSAVFITDVYRGRSILAYLTVKSYFPRSTAFYGSLKDYIIVTRLTPEESEQFLLQKYGSSYPFNWLNEIREKNKKVCLIPGLYSGTDKTICLSITNDRSPRSTSG